MYNETMQPDSEDGQNYWQPQEETAKNGDAPVENIPPATQQPPVDEVPAESISWEASESIDHERDGTWFIGFISVVVILLGVSVWQQQWTFTALIVIMAVAMMVYIRRPTRVLRYSLSFNGLHVGEQFHSFDEFRSFGILEDGALFSVMLMPTKRFGQALTIYFTENEGEKIVDILGAYLPMETLHLDAMDNLLRRLRL
ncbi:hypothetical protein A3F64_02320 [Candidatus Saccharibacteria bacterium RIFCSPHIGHO2_12_FULL_42_8]|nr:MAG: hypothetical protein A3F64_02320 [Candidatus Saccharibacteria bacterium RIFCSPHIGHO2_12_FULL_42_8]